MIIEDPQKISFNYSKTNIVTFYKYKFHFNKIYKVNFKKNIDKNSSTPLLNCYVSNSKGFETQLINSILYFFR